MIIAKFYEPFVDPWGDKVLRGREGWKGQDVLFDEGGIVGVIRKYIDEIWQTKFDILPFLFEFCK